MKILSTENAKTQEVDFENIIDGFVSVEVRVHVFLFPSGAGTAKAQQELSLGPASAGPGAWHTVGVQKVCVE